MNDLEKIIKGLEAISLEAYDRFVHTPYINDKLLKMIDETVPDAIDLLRKQEPARSITPTVESCAEIVRCEDCKHWDGHTEECCNVDSICFRNGRCRPDWFCADGELRSDNKEDN